MKKIKEIWKEWMALPEDERGIRNKSGLIIINVVKPGRKIIKKVWWPLCGFYLRNWKWLWGTFITVVLGVAGLVIAYLSMKGP